VEIYATPLYEGTFSVGLDKKFVRINRDDPPKKGALKLSINPFLIHTPNRNYLFDTGLGEFGEGTSCDTIRQNLAHYGLSEYDITDIFLSHLHYDHLGGLAEHCNGYWELTFPEARLWVSKKGWEATMGKGTYYDDYKTEFIHFIDAKADLHFLEEKDQPYPEIKVKKIGGHTQFHQALFFESGSHKFLMAGDVIGTSGAVNRKFAAKYDFEPKESMKARRELTQLAYEEGYTLMSYHDNVHPLYRLTDHKKRKGYKIEAVEAHVPSE